MKILLLLLLVLTSQYIKDKDLKKYLSIGISLISIGLATAAMFMSLNVVHVQFQMYEYMPWLTFWLIIVLRVNFEKPIEEKLFLWPSALALSILNFSFGVYNFLAIEFVYIWFMLLNNQKIYKHFELLYFLKFLMLVLVVFSQNLTFGESYPVFKIIISTTILISLIYTLFNEDFFQYFYTVNIIALLKIITTEEVVLFKYDVDIFVLLICLKLTYLTLKNCDLIKPVSNVMPQLDKLTIFLNLKLYRRAEISFDLHEPEYKEKEKTIVVAKNFSNDLASSILLVFIIIFVFVSYFLYRIN